MSSTNDRPIALVGLMGAGKSAVADVLGERLGTAVADLDAMLEAETGCSVAELFAREGEPAFRRREAALFERVQAAGAGVIACGGGLVLDPRCRELLRTGCRTVWLEVAPATAARRIGAGAGRPLLHGAPPVERLATVLGERSSLYAEVAGARVTTEGRTAAEVADAVMEALARTASEGGVR
jgi:shikimate kinase